MKKILVINSKGGCGKSTLATNLASYFAHHGEQTALMDYDPQGSTMQWLKLRPAHLNPIHGANASRRKGNVIRSWQMVVPFDTEKLIIDAPAGVDGILLQELVQRADNIIIPVAPSPVDIHATSDFIKDLFLIGKIRSQKTDVAVGFTGNCLHGLGKLRFTHVIEIAVRGNADQGLLYVRNSDAFLHRNRPHHGVWQRSIHATPW